MTLIEIVDMVMSTSKYQSVFNQTLFQYTENGHGLESRIKFQLRWAVDKQCPHTLKGLGNFYKFEWVNNVKSRWEMLVNSLQRGLMAEI